MRLKFKAKHFEIRFTVCVKLCFIQDRSINEQRKLWMNISPRGCYMSSREQKTLLPKGARLQLLIIQKHSPELPDFRQYFLGVLQNNYRSYSLLATYMQQVIVIFYIKLDGNKCTFYRYLTAQWWAQLAISLAKIYRKTR